MTVKDVMDEIKAAKEHSKLLRQLANIEKDEHIKDCLEESSELLDEYVDMLEQMKVQ